MLKNRGKKLPISEKIMYFCSGFQLNLAITEDLRLYYYRGIQNWEHTNGYLQDTCLTAQDNYKALLDYFKIKH